jgi:hypothetical protein
MKDSRGGALTVLGGLAFLLPALTSRLAVADEKPGEPMTIKKVVSAKLEMADGALTVTVVGEVPTGGYTKPTLTRVTYFRQPDDGIQDYLFQAVPPTGVSAQVISQVTASDKWPALPKWVKGVRIHGARDGMLVKMLGDK